MKKKKNNLASLGQNNKAGVVRPVKHRQINLVSVRNHFKPEGEFVKEGTKIKVDSVLADALVNSGNWQII